MKTRNLTIAALAIALMISADAAHARGSGGHSGSLSRVPLSHSNSAAYPPHLPYNKQGEPSDGHVFMQFLR